MQEAQRILIHCGAVSYCVDQLVRRHQAAHQILVSIPLVRREALETLLEEIIAPVRRLFEEVRKSRGVDQRGKVGS